MVSGGWLPQVTCLRVGPARVLRRLVCEGNRNRRRDRRTIFNRWGLRFELAEYRGIMGQFTERHARW